MSEKTVVVALGHKALGTTLPEQKIATKAAAKAIADLVEDGTNIVISHSNGPQVGMIHTAMNEFGKAHPKYTFAPSNGLRTNLCQLSRRPARFFNRFCFELEIDIRVYCYLSITFNLSFNSLASLNACC